jgi:hypothetical protein
MIQARLPLNTGLYGPPRLPSDENFWAEARGTIAGATFTPQGGYVTDPQLATHNLMRAAEAKGSQFIYNAEVSDVRQAGGRVIGVTLKDGTMLDAPIVVNAAGPHSFIINRLAEPRVGALPAARIQGQLAGLQEVLGPIPPDRLTELESGNTRDISEAHMAGALQLFKSAHKLAVICFNDDAALGALAAARAAGREKDVVIVGQGADRQVRTEIRRPHSRIIGSTAFRPEAYGEKLVALALKLLRGEPLPPATYIDHTFVDAETVDLVYPE